MGESPPAPDRMARPGRRVSTTQSEHSGSPGTALAALRRGDDLRGVKSMLRFDEREGGLDCFFSLLGACVGMSEGPEPAGPSVGKGPASKNEDAEIDWLR